MIPALVAARALAQETPPSPEPASPPPVEEPPPPVEPAPEPMPVPVPTAAEPQPTVTPWVEVLDDRPSREPSSTPFGVFLEGASMGNDDPAYDVFASPNAMGGLGAAVAVNLGANFAVVGGWHHYRHGATVVMDDLDGGENTEFRSAISSNEGALGLRVTGGIARLLYPYVSAQGLLMHSRMRFDDVPDENDNPGQVQASGVSPGMVGTGGVEVRLPRDSDVKLAWTLELGHAWLARASYGDFGTMQAGGFVARSGLGLRF